MSWLVAVIYLKGDAAQHKVAQLGLHNTLARL